MQAGPERSKSDLGTINDIMESGQMGPNPLNRVTKRHNENITFYQTTYVGSNRIQGSNVTNNKYFYLPHCLTFKGLLFSFDVGNCDHLDPYPVYSGTHHNINFTTWNEPWHPEIDWLDSYVNMSSFSQDILDGLFLGYRLSKRDKYFFRGEYGCWILFEFDIEVIQAHYLKYYADTNQSMLFCTPNIPMRSDVYRAWTERNYWLVWCNNYYMGL